MSLSVVTRGFGPAGGIAIVPTRGFTPGAVGPLTAGILSATPHATSVDLVVTAATGGVPPRTYFFQRRGTFIPPSAFTWDDVASGIDLLAFTGTGLAPLTAYHYRVTVVDAASNVVTSNVVDVTTLAALTRVIPLKGTSTATALKGTVTPARALSGN